MIDKSKNNRIYLSGWTFQNPVGIKKYHKQIVKIFRPKENIMKNVEDFLRPFKEDFLVGVHIRQGDYLRHMKGKLYFNQKSVSEILKYYLKNEHLHRSKTVFILVSDGPIDLNYYKGLRVILGPGSAIEDMFSLSKCKVILASESSFSSFASYYGTKPLYLFDRKSHYKSVDPLSVQPLHYNSRLSAKIK